MAFTVQTIVPNINCTCQCDKSRATNSYDAVTILCSIFLHHDIMLVCQEICVGGSGLIAHQTE